MDETKEDFMEDTLSRLHREGLKRDLRQLSGTQGRSVVIDGKRVLNFCSNNYLGLADDARLRQAAIDCIEQEGFGSGASRLVCGNMAAHQSLEEYLARFKGTQRCLVFSTGYSRSSIRYVPSADERVPADGSAAASSPSQASAFSSKSEPCCQPDPVTRSSTILRIRFRNASSSTLRERLFCPGRTLIIVVSSSACNSPPTAMIRRSTSATALILSPNPVFASAASSERGTAV